MTAATARRGARAGRAGLGLFALALFAAAIGATWVFLQGGFRSGVPVEAVFSDPGVGQQLPVNGDVKVRGVLVGTIADIRLDGDGNAVVELSLDDGMDLPTTTRAEIRSKTVFGQKWVELIPPEDDTGPVLAAGSVIPDDQTKEPLELERALQLGHDLLSEIPLRELSVTFRELADGFSGHERAARQAIDRGLVALEAVNSRSDELDEALGQLAELAAFVDDTDDDLLSFMESLDSANRALVGAAPELRSNLDSVPVFLNELAAFQERTENDLGALIEDGADLAELLTARDDQLVDLVVQLEAFLTVWNSGLSQPCGGEFEDDMTCWQVYVLPGLESRGLYGRGEAPDRDERGDPTAGAVIDLPELAADELRSVVSDVIEARDEGDQMDHVEAGDLHGRDGGRHHMARGDHRELQLFGNAYRISAEFTDATGLLSGDVVKAAGVSVGRVEEIRVDDGIALVTMSIRDNVELRQTWGRRYVSAT